MARHVAFALAAAVVLASCSFGGESRRPLVVGAPPPPPSTTTTGPVVLPDPTPPPSPALNGRGLFPADGHPPGDPIAFRSSIPVSPDLVFILVVGSDARPGEELRKSHADSLHLLAVNPKIGAATVLGFPRDCWVEIPGHGRGKLNSAMVLGGPDLLARTIENLTGLPIHYYVLTGFPGLTHIVDALGGVDVLVDHVMDDHDSGAHFEAGWHHFDGAQALAYSRDRHDVADGDFTRSAHQGDIILAALAKMRAEVGDDDALRRWIGVLLRDADLDVPLDRLAPLGALARRLDPGRVQNLVAPGQAGWAGNQSVVYLDQRAVQIFLDLRDDGIVGAEPPPVDTTTTSSEPTTTTEPPATTTTAAPLLHW